MKELTGDKNKRLTKENKHLLGQVEKLESQIDELETSEPELSIDFAPYYVKLDLIAHNARLLKQGDIDPLELADNILREENNFRTLLNLLQKEA